MRDFAWRMIYPIPDPPNLVRDRPMRVMALGLSRTGTESLKQALTILGYDHVYHGFDFLKKPEQVYAWVRLLEAKLHGDRSDSRNDLDKILGDCEAVSDLPCSALAPELLKAYPDALVVANRRTDVDSWHKSYSITVDPLVTNWLYSLLCHFEPEAYWARRLVCDVQKIHYWGNFQARGRAGYEAHYQLVHSLAKGRVLDWKVEDGWEPLCKFLGKQIPSVDFPRGNDPAAFEAEKIRVTEDRFNRAYRNLLVIIGSLVLGVAVSIAFYYRVI